METISDRLVIASFKDGILTCLFCGEKAVQLNFEKGKSSLVGNIYAGRVRHIVSNIDAAFVDIGEETPAYFSLDEKSGPVYLDGKKHDRLKEGDEILVKVKKDAVKTKNAVCSSVFREASNWDFLNRCSMRKAPCLVKEAEPFWQYLAEKVLDSGQAEAVTDIPAVSETLNRYSEKCRLYADETLPLMKLYSLETIADEALSGKVWLKDGGYLVIEPTEAMTVIDVNTGKTDRKGTREDIILKTNREAAAEIARQLRLRNISGIVMVDFINMKTPEEKEDLLKDLNTLLSGDPVETSAVDMTSLDIAEIVRRKTGKPFSEQMKV